MTTDPRTSSITLSTQTIHNPAEPRHFMRIKPVKGRVSVTIGGHLLADSAAAVRLIESGKDIYDPVYYFPRADVLGTLRAREGERTWCPLKGHASYFDATAGGQTVKAWSYDECLDFASELEGLIAFYPAGVTFTETPSG